MFKISNKMFWVSGVIAKYKNNVDHCHRKAMRLMCGTRVRAKLLSNVFLSSFSFSSRSGLEHFLIINIVFGFVHGHKYKEM